MAKAAKDAARIAIKYVLNAFAIFGFALAIKNIKIATTKKAFIVWLLTPSYCFVLSYLLALAF